MMSSALNEYFSSTRSSAIACGSGDDSFASNSALPKIHLPGANFMADVCQKTLLAFIFGCSTERFIQFKNRQFVEHLHQLIAKGNRQLDFTRAIPQTNLGFLLP